MAATANAAALGGWQYTFQSQPPSPFTLRSFEGLIRTSCVLILTGLVNYLNHTVGRSSEPTAQQLLAAWAHSQSE